MTCLRNTAATVIFLACGLLPASPEAVPRKPDPSKEGGFSIAPVVGYDPTFGIVLGGAVFNERPSLFLHADANTNFGRVYQLHYSYRHFFANFWEHGLKGGLTSGFDPYYGDGNATVASSYVKLWGFQTAHRFYTGFRTGENSQVGALIDVRTRTERPGKDSPAATVAPDEQTAALGVYFRLDTRRANIDTADGFSLGLQLSHVPAPLSSVPGSDFTQIEADFIVYKEILNGVIPDVVAAFNVKGGTTIGTPTYLFNYRLGGSNALRGYLENRFRGKRYYLQQTELRFPLYKPVSGVLFIGFGDASTTTFGDAKMASGFGLRIGIPPDYVSALRLDFGFAKDQWGFFANFGQVF